MPSALRRVMGVPTCLDMSPGFQQRLRCAPGTNPWHLLGCLTARLCPIVSRRVHAGRNVGVCDAGYTVVASAPLKDKDESCEHADSACTHQASPHETLAGLGKVFTRSRGSRWGSDERNRLIRILVIAVLGDGLTVALQLLQEHEFLAGKARAVTSSVVADFVGTTLVLDAMTVSWVSATASSVTMV